MSEKPNNASALALFTVVIIHAFASSFASAAGTDKATAPSASLTLAKRSKSTAGTDKATAPSASLTLAKRSKSAAEPVSTSQSSSANNRKSVNDNSGEKNTSPAANCGGGVSVQVNRRTGGLEVNIRNVELDGVTDDMDICLGLVKTESDKTPFNLGFPGGWALSNIDYIDASDQKAVTVHVNGNRFTVDKSFATNLRYVRSKSRYLDLKARDFPYEHPNGNVEVHYTLMGFEGRKSYFGPNGKLWGRDDRFGNHVMIVYDKKDETPFKAMIRGIIDSYGNEIKIDYKTNKVVVTMPDKRTAEYAYSWNKETLTVKDLEGRETRLKLYKNKYVTLVEYPTGGTTTFDWNNDEIPYKAPNGAKQYFPAVVRAKSHPGKESDSPPMTEEYEYGKDGRYFTYWDHDFRTREGGDGLMESHDDSYNYTNWKILKSGSGKADDVREAITYNFLNLPIETKVYHGGKLMDSSIIHYLGETMTSRSDPLSINHKFQPLHDLPANYAEPCSEATIYYGDQGKRRVALTLTEFNDYGLATKVTKYDSEPGDDSIGDLNVTSVTTTDYHLPDEQSPFDYARGYGQVKTKIVNDLVNGEETTTTNTLGDGDRFLKSSKVAKRYSDGEDGADGKTRLYAVDGHGRPTSGEIHFTKLSAFGDDGQPTAAEIRQKYTQNGGLLTIERTRVGTMFGKDIVKSRVIDVTNGRLVSETDALVRTTRKRYDNEGLTVTTTHPDNSWKRENRLNPNVAITESSNGLVEKRYLDGLGRVVLETDNLGQDHKERVLVKYKYDAFGRVCEKTDVHGRSTRYFHDYQGRETKTVDEHLGVIEEIKYDDVAMTSTTYLSVEGGSGGRVKVAMSLHDDDGQVVMEESFLADGGGPLAKNVMKYDGQGREISSNVVEIASDGSETTIMTTSTRHAIDGEVLSYTLTTRDGVKATGTWTRGLFGDTVSKKLMFSAVSPGMVQPTQPVLSETNYYNSFGELIKLVNQKGQTIFYSYDGNGNLKAMTDFAGTKTTYAYDEMDRMTLMTCGDIQQKNEYYDGVAKSMAAGQLKSRTLVAKGEEKDKIIYEYDERGLTSSVTRNGKTMSVTYDDFQRMRTLTDYAGVTTQYDYCDGSPAGVPDDNVKTISNPFGSVAYSYYTKTDGPLFGDGTSIRQLTYRDAKGRIVATIEYDYYGLAKPRAGDGDTTRKPMLRSVRTLNAKRELVSESIYEYERSKIKTVKRKSETAPNDLNRNHVKIYTYNDMGLLIREDVYGPECEKQIGVTEYACDANRNVVGRTIKDAKGDVVENDAYAYDEIDQLTVLKELVKGTARSFEYDKNGNMVAMQAGDENWIEKFDYNVLNQMTRYRHRNTGADVSYDYDAESLRKSKYPTENRNGAISFHYLDDDVINESDATGAMTSYLIHDGRRALRALDGETRMWYVIDAKDVIGALGPSGAKQIESYSYAPYGERKDLNAVSAQTKGSAYDGKLTLARNPFGYNGEYLDPESGLIYLRARYYSPELMRFVNRDTYDVSNRYAYGDGDPINNIDPSGHNALSFGLALAALVTSIVATALTFGAAAPSTFGAIASIAGVLTGVYGTTMEGVKTTEDRSWNDSSWRSEDTFSNVVNIVSVGFDFGTGTLAAKGFTTEMGIMKKTRTAVRASKYVAKPFEEEDVDQEAEGLMPPPDLPKRSWLDDAPKADEAGKQSVTDTSGKTFDRSTNNDRDTPYKTSVDDLFDPF